MKIYPAIDIYDGKAVRLFKGDYAKMTVYSDDPCAVAKEFEACGAECIHIVDLEGAKFGQTTNLEVIKKIAESTSLFIEVGGGIRDIDAVERVLGAGASRVIIGTAAVTDEAFLKEALRRYGDKIAVSADAKDGYVALKGWTESSAISLADFMERMAELGVRTVICTDISKDGAMSGTNTALYTELSEKYRSQIDIIASGGVSSLDDVLRLKGIGVGGAIIGKAYYIGAIDLKGAIEVGHDN